MASNATNRQAFINSLRKFLLTYAFDGVDIDWQVGIIAKPQTT